MPGQAMRLMGRVLSFALALLLMTAVLALGLLFSVASLALGQATPKRLALGLATLAVLGGAIGALAYLAVSSGLTQAPPPQPLAFPHSIHAGKLGIDCLFCHRTARTGASATFPSVEQCMVCHKVAARDRPEVAKLVAAAESGQPLDWVRVNRLPDSAHFDHQPHALAGVGCATCHGPVETMTEVRKVRPLKMGDCLGCHRERSAPTDCSVCHY